MNVGNEVIHGLRTPKMVANFHIFPYLKILYTKEGKSEYMCLRTEVSFEKMQFTSNWLIFLIYLVLFSVFLLI